MCEKFYTETLAISEDIIFGAFNKLEEFGVVSDDKRGKRNKEKISASAENYIIRTHK